MTPSGERRHRSISVTTATGDETMYCGLRITHDRINRVWQSVNCRSCIKRGAAS